MVSHMKDPVYKVLQILTFILFIILSILIFVQVILRYFFSAPIAWNDEISRLLMIWVSCLGIALAYFKKQHAAITFAVDKFKGKAKTAYEFASDLLLLAAFLLITYAGIKLCISTHRFCSAVLRYPNSLQYAALPVSTACMAYRTAYDLIELVRKKKGTREEELL